MAKQEAFRPAPDEEDADYNAKVLHFNSQKFARALRKQTEMNAALERGAFF